MNYVKATSYLENGFLVRKSTVRLPQCSAMLDKCKLSCKHTEQVSIYASSK